jgi:hypothetical protein
MENSRTNSESKDILKTQLNLCENLQQRWTQIDDKKWSVKVLLVLLLNSFLEPVLTNLLRVGLKELIQLKELIYSPRKTI